MGPRKFAQPHARRTMCTREIRRTTCQAYHVHARNSQNHMLGAPCARAKFAEPHAGRTMCTREIRRTTWSAHHVHARNSQNHMPGVPGARAKFAEPHARRTMCTREIRRTTCLAYHGHARNSQNHMLGAPGARAKFAEPHSLCMLVLIISHDVVSNRFCGRTHVQYGRTKKVLQILRTTTAGYLIIHFFREHLMRTPNDVSN